MACSERLVNLGSGEGESYARKLAKFMRDHVLTAMNTDRVWKTSTRAAVHIDSAPHQRDRSIRPPTLQKDGWVTLRVRRGVLDEISPVSWMVDV